MEYVLSFPLKLPLCFFRSTSPRSLSRSPGRSSSRSPARRLDETDEAQLERLYKPVFVVKPVPFKCAEGQTARFDLKVVGRPMPDTYWFHNGTRHLDLDSTTYCRYSRVGKKELCLFNSCKCNLFFSGQQVVSDHNHKIVVKEDGTQSLIIVPAMPHDSGEWTVVAQNRAGKSTISVTLTVDGEFTDSLCCNISGFQC